MELYYNPERMPDAEIKQTFVAREALLKELVDLVRRQPEGAGVQHVVLIGARGMGKTTMLLMLRFAILDSVLAKKWQPVRFPEESYAVTDLADFWLAALGHLAEETGDQALSERADALKDEFPESAALSDAAFALLKDWRRKNKKRLLLLVDSLDAILEQIGDTAEQARLRDALMNDGTVMLIGGATLFFREARNYDRPLYNFFRTWNLEELNTEQINALLLQRAAADKRAGFEEQLKRNEARIQVLHYFTGGNPRLVLMLYGIIASSDLIDVRRGLEKLLDEVTPYYKAKIESLPPQQRKILDHIARVSARTGYALTPTEIARETRLPVNQVTSQLKRLSNLGYVRAANVRARSSWYSLAEPLYAVWHQMRFGREGRRRMEWLVEFLKQWYTGREMFEEYERLASRFAGLLRAGDKALAIATLDYRQYLVDAMNPRDRGGPIDRIVCDCLDAGELDRARQTVQEEGLESLCLSTLNRLSEIKVLEAGELGREHARRRQWMELVTDLVRNRQWEEVASAIGCSGVMPPDFPSLKIHHAFALLQLGRHEETLADLDICRKYIPTDVNQAVVKADVLGRLGQHKDAIGTLNPFADQLASNAWAQRILAFAHGAIGEFEKAIEICEVQIGRGDTSLRELMLLLEPIRARYENNPGIFLVFHVERGAFDEARRVWKKMLGRLEPVYMGALVALASRSLSGFDFVRELIRESELGGQLAALSAALSAVETGDRSQVEKLSSELRPVAEWMATTIERERKAKSRRKSRAGGGNADHKLRWYAPRDQSLG